MEPTSSQTYEKLVPVLSEPGANDTDCAEDTAEENGSATTEIVVEGIREPTSGEHTRQVRAVERMSFIKIQLRSRPYPCNGRQFRSSVERSDVNVQH
jgi:hypothetical protein